jgi:hypothetical protein
MRIAVSHHTTKEKARKQLDKKLTSLLNQFGSSGDFEHSWSGDTLSFKGKARGFSLKGTVEVTDTEVIIEGKLPMLAIPFEPKIREAVKREADSMFKTA